MLIRKLMISFIFYSALSNIPHEFRDNSIKVNPPRLLGHWFYLVFLSIEIFVSSLLASLFCFKSLVSSQILRAIYTAIVTLLPPYLVHAFFWGF